MDDGRYHIHLDVFEGPLDLLYHLIRKNEVDIYDIPIADIADQYLKTIELMKAMNIDLAGEFLVMAATLMHIKSRMLLPRHEGEEDEEDPRLQIVRPLTEYLQIKDAAERIGSRPMLGEEVWTREPGDEPFEPSPEDEILTVGLFELIDAFAEILRKAKETPQVNLAAETLTVRQRINELSDILAERQTATFTELFEGDATRGELVVTFLAILEMVKLELVRIAQHVQSGVLRIFLA